MMEYSNVIYLLLVLILVVPAAWYGFRSGAPVIKYALIWVAVGLFVAVLYYLFRP